jgi:hypothetical protein
MRLLFGKSIRWLVPAARILEGSKGQWQGLHSSGGVTCHDSPRRYSSAVGQEGRKALIVEYSGYNEQSRDTSQPLMMEAQTVSETLATIFIITRLIAWEVFIVLTVIFLVGHAGNKSSIRICHSSLKITTPGSLWSLKLHWKLPM